MTIKKEKHDDLVIFKNKQQRFSWRVRFNESIKDTNDPRYANLKLIAKKQHNLYLSRDGLATLMETLMYAATNK